MQPSPHQPPPGARLVEHHAHILWHGQAMDRVDLSEVTSADQALERIAQRRAERDGPVIAAGARPEAWSPPTWPTLRQLDDACGDRPCLIWCFDHHSVMVNTAALLVVGISAATPDPAGGLIHRDDAGNPTGLLAEAAATRFRDWDAREPGAARRHLSLALADFRAHGFAEIHDMLATPALIEALASLPGDAPRATVYVPLDDLHRVAASRAEWESDRLVLGGGKVFVDGTLNSRTAWMLHPYADGFAGHPRGVALMTPGELEDAVRRCDALGVPLAAHAIGDGAVRAVLDAVEAVRPRTRGFRVEHAEVIDEVDVPRFARLGVAASVQPCHLLYDIEALHRAVPRRLGRVLPLRELVESGCEPGELLLFGSDAPIVRPDPGDSLQAAIERRRPDMPAAAAIGPGQALTSRECLAAFGMGKL